MENMQYDLYTITSKALSYYQAKTYHIHAIIMLLLFFDMYTLIKQPILHQLF